MKVVIIDDEPKARNLLRVLVQEECENIDAIFLAENLLEGVEIIKKEQPQIVLLDIEMPKHSGLEILDFIKEEEHNFEIIFVTAYSEYAIRAFKLSAVDYLLKPINTSQLKNAFKRAEKNISNHLTTQRIESLKHNLSANVIEKIAIPITNSIKFVDVKDVLYLKANGMYTQFYLKDVKDPILTSKPLKHFIDLFINTNYFYKPHRSFLVNLNYIKEFSRLDGGYIIMSNGDVVSLTKEKKKEFFTLLKLN